MKNRIKSAALILILLFSLISAQKTSFVIGVENLDYLPYYTTTQTGEYLGFARELLDAFAESKGYTFTYQPLPVNKLYLFHKLQKIDLKFPDDPNWNPQMKEGVAIIYSDPVVPYTDGVMVLQENKGKGIENVKKLGVALGFTPWQYMDKIKDGSITEVTSPNMEILVQQATKKVVDGIYINPSVARYILREKLNTSENDLLFDEALPHAKGSYLVSSSTSPELVKEFNEFLKNNQTLLNQLIERHKIK